MSVGWNGMFLLPEEALAGGRRVSKAMLAQKAELTRREQTVLDRVARTEQCPHPAAWTIGSRIVHMRAEEDWSAKDIGRVSHDPSEAFPDMKGLPSTNIKYMRRFAAA